MIRGVRGGFRVLHCCIRSSKWIQSTPIVNIRLLHTKDKLQRLSTAISPSDVVKRQDLDDYSITRVNTGKGAVTAEDDTSNGPGSIENLHTEWEELSSAEKEGAFFNFPISQKTVDKLRARNMTYLFPVQYKTFQDVYDGRDVIVQARTGTGKTYAFTIPLVEKLTMSNDRRRGRAPRVLVMAPTRELANQTGNEFRSISDLDVVCIYGGAAYGPQEKALHAGCDVVVGTPGRVLDMVQKGSIEMSNLQHVVLDEVDHMLDIGFAESVDDILRSVYDKENPSNNPQTLLFSATLPSWVYNTAKKYMRDNVKKTDLIGSDRIKTATTVQHLAIKSSYYDRPSVIGDVIRVYCGNQDRCMVFCQTKREADELAVSRVLKRETHVLHGDIPQAKRELVLKGFKEGRYNCLVTTDVAARGLDIPEVELVIQCSPPKDVDFYIHRSGRTGRAGRAGTCICLYTNQQEDDLKKVEGIAGIKFKRIGPPTADAIVKVATADAVRSLENIPESTLEYFRSSAANFLKENDAIEALSAALAVMSGGTEITSRSLLSGRQGYTTYLFRSSQEIDKLGYVWRSLERHIPDEVKKRINRMILCADRMGCAFDLPSDLDSVIEDRWVDGTYDTLIKATELPELVEY